MDDRTANLSWIQSAFLLGFEEGRKESTGVSDAELQRRRHTLYATIIQAGVDRLDLQGLGTDNVRGPLAKRLVDTTLGKAWAEYFLIVNEAFGLLGDSEQLVGKDDMLRGFLADLLFALHNRHSLVMLSGLPNVSELQSELPVELFIPVRNLFSAITTTDDELPGVRYDVSPKAVVQYEEILASSLYIDYKAASKGLESSTHPQQQALQDVRTTAARLAKRNAALLTPTKSRVSILQFTAKIVDTILGGLPGKLAGIAADLGSKAMAQEYRFTIYDFSGNIRDIYRIHRASHDSAESTQKEA